MKREIKEIKTTDGKKLPYICTNNVLARMQSAYGSIDAFYLSLIGKEIVLDADGDERHDEDGRRILKNREPDIATANLFLTEMVNEALEMKGEAGDYTIGEVVRITDQPVFLRVAYLVEAFNDCFSLGNDKDEKKRRPSRKEE